MDILKSKCLILKKKDLNEADLLTVVFSKDFGKISGVAFGIRKSKKRNLITNMYRWRPKKINYMGKRKRIIYIDYINL